ncbi:MAG: hypothetical protein A3F68_09210 [Acidobacteria bacterium RIFCSPLOWO2_12_FULL_54_10]|nr:MAG: hypothetical protein A3F68_09210 [Acidobacteria bacterium RIFCSPLOWO2_12_FULL_54_10]
MKWPFVIRCSAYRFLSSLGWLLAIVLISVPGDAQTTDQTFRPLTQGEKLTFLLSWPGGNALGEASLDASTAGDEIHFQVRAEASLPSYALRDSFSSVANRELCSVSFHQQLREGKNVGENSIDYANLASEPKNAARSTSATKTNTGCARDPMSFLYYFRSKLAAGQAIESGFIDLNNQVAVSIRAAGNENLSYRGQQRPTQKFLVTYSSSGEDTRIEVWFSEDAERLPLRVRVPFPLAVFTAELQ